MRFKKFLQTVPMKLWIILIVVVLFSFFSNDFGLVDIQKTAIILAAGIDKTENGFSLTAQIAVPKGSDRTTGGTSSVEIGAEGKPVSVVLGFNTADEVFYADEFRALGCDVHVATADGSAGTKGFVTTAIAGQGIDFDYFYACGPLPMLRALCDSVAQDGQLSFEERMGCGFGACMGCSCKTKYGNKRICKEGPVLTKGEIIW